MIADAAHDRLRAALRAELNRHYGRIGEIEQGLDRAEGYLGKYCRGEISIPVDVLLKCLEQIEVEPGQFFCQALGAPPDSSAYLRDIMASEPDKALSRLQKAAAEAALEMPPFDPTDFSGFSVSAAAQPSAAISQLVADMAACTATEQRRRLRSTKKYRTEEFAWAYLAQIVQTSYSEPKMAAKQAVVVGADLIMKIPGISDRNRLELILRSISVWVFATRLGDGFRQAALGSYFALALATAHRFDRMRAELLRTGAMVLVDNGLYPASLHLLGEAAVICHDLGDAQAVARIQVQRGGTLTSIGDYALAVQVLKQALTHFSAENTAEKVYRLATLQRLSRVYEIAGEIDEAERWLEMAIAALDPEQKINVAKLTWQMARLNSKRGAQELAETRLKVALDILIECQASESTLVALDLARVLLSLKKAGEAVDLARGMSRLITSARTSLVDQAVLTQFVRAAVEGELTITLMDELERATQQKKRARA